MPLVYDRKVIYDGYEHTYSFVICGKKIILAPLQPIMEAISTKGEKSALMSYGDCKEEIAKGVTPQLKVEHVTTIACS